MIDFKIYEILLIVSISFIIKNIEGPFGIFSKIRNRLFLNKFLGSFFFKLISCPFCIGYWSGMLSYVLSRHNFNIDNIIIFGICGSIINYTFNVLMEKIQDG